jgi:hypothetical protein
MGALRSSPNVLTVAYHTLIRHGDSESVARAYGESKELEALE